MTGLLFDAFPGGRADPARSDKTLIFEDGRGLTITSCGAYWIDSPEDIRSAISKIQREIGERQAELATQLANSVILEGAAPGGGGATPEAGEG